MENQTIKRQLADDQRDKFFHILKILNHYYTMQKIKSADQDFRIRITEDQENTQVEMQQIGTYEFQITATNQGETKEWIHMDGIQEEREKLPKDHPVHFIVCMTDIYEASK